MSHRDTLKIKWVNSSTIFETVTCNIALNKYYGKYISYEDLKIMHLFKDYFSSRQRKIKTIQIYLKTLMMYHILQRFPAWFQIS